MLRWDQHSRSCDALLCVQRWRGLTILTGPASTTGLLALKAGYEFLCERSFSGIHKNVGVPSAHGLLTALRLGGAASQKVSCDPAKPGWLCTWHAWH